MRLKCLYPRIPSYVPRATNVSLPCLFSHPESFATRAFTSIEGSRPTLEALVQYLDEQGLTRRRMKVEELFAPNIQPELLHYLRATGED